MNVLIVDDSVVQAEHLASTLADLGHYVVGCARSGATGVMLYQENKPDLVFLDLIMPEVDGPTALRAIRALDPQAKVIVLSSVAADDGMGEQVRGLGATDVLSKPYTAEDIRQAIGRLSKT